MEAPPLTLALFGLGTMLGLLVLLRIAQRVLGASRTMGPQAAPSPSPAEPGSKAPASPSAAPAEAQARHVQAPPEKARPRVDPLEGNTARRMLQVGQVLGVFLVASSAVKGAVHGASFASDLVRDAISSVIALVLVMITGHLGVRALLRARLPAELARGNVAAGVAAGAHYVAVAIITSRAVSAGDLRDLGLSLAFFVLGQVTLIVFVTLFRALTTYDDAEQIQGENLAAALSYAGVSIAIAVIVARALEGGDFVGWGEALKGYGEVLLFLLALYPVRQILVQVVLLGAPFSFRGGRLDAGVAAERNEGMGALEAATYLATALAFAELA